MKKLSKRMNESDSPMLLTVYLLLHLDWCTLAFITLMGYMGCFKSNANTIYHSYTELCLTVYVF